MKVQQDEVASRMTSPIRPRRGVSAGFVVALACVTVLIGTACNSSARAQPIPTVPPQPTLNKTMDAVVRGLLPTATRPTATRSALEAPRDPAPPPEPRAPTATESTARPATLATRDLADQTGVTPSATRPIPTETREAALPPSLTTAPPATATPAPALVPTRPLTPGRSDEPVGAVRAPPTPTARDTR